MVIVKEISAKGSKRPGMNVKVSLRAPWGRERKAPVLLCLQTESTWLQFSAPSHHHPWDGSGGVWAFSIEGNRHGQKTWMSILKMASEDVECWIFLVGASQDC